MSTELRQRAPRQEDRAHLAFIRTRPCCIKHCNRQAEAAHIRMACLALGKEYTGKAEKPDDRWTVPLCPYHHRIGIASQHSMGEADFWQMVGINPFPIAIELFRLSGGAERAAAPKPRKAPRKIKARKPRAMRRKVAAGRPLRSNPVIQSRGFAKPALRSAPSSVQGGNHALFADAEQPHDQVPISRSQPLDRAYQRDRRDHSGFDRKALVTPSSTGATP